MVPAPNLRRPLERPTSQCELSLPTRRWTMRSIALGSLIFLLALPAVARGEDSKKVCRKGEACDKGSACEACPKKSASTACDEAAACCDKAAKTACCEAGKRETACCKAAE